jgi:hypothetical protein
MLKHIYFTFVHSRILYGIEVYTNTCGSYLDKLVKLNNKFLRILQNKTIFTPIFELYLEYNTLPIPHSSIFNSCSYLFINLCIIRTRYLLSLLKIITLFLIAKYITILLG